MELRRFLKNSRMQYNTMVSTLFNSFLGEKETYVLFLLKKKKELFGQCNSFYSFVCHENT